MAYRRSITARVKFFYQQQQRRFSPSISHTHRDDNDCEKSKMKPISRNPEGRHYIQHRLFGAGNNFCNYRRSTKALQDRRFVIPAGCGMACDRNYSSANAGEGAADNIEVLNEVVGVLGDKAAEVAPVVNEVAIAAADSYPPVAALQYLIDYVHCFTGFSWWASIAATTLIIRWMMLPLIINQMKSTSRFTLLKPQLEAVREEMQNKGMSPSAVAEGQAKMKALFNEYGVTPFTPLKGLLISGPVFCSFFFAVSNMAEKVPSFKEGGTLWFTDLTTPDSLYVFPVLTALTFWVTVECNAQEGMEGNPTAGTIKNVCRIFAAVTVPLTASFPKAIFCYWITSNLFSLVYGLVMKIPEVKKFLGIPIIPATPPSTNQRPGLSFLESLTKYAESQAHQRQSLSSSAEASSKPMDQVVASSSVLNQRIKRLEKEGKGRKKGKKKVIQR